MPRRAAQHCPACRVDYVASAAVCADCRGPLRPGRTPPPDDRVVPFEDPADVAAIVERPGPRRSLRDWGRGVVVVPLALGVVLLLCSPFMPSGPFFEAAEAREVARAAGWGLLALGAALGLFAAPLLRATTPSSGEAG